MKRMPGLLSFVESDMRQYKTHLLFIVIALAATLGCNLPSLAGQQPAIATPASPQTAAPAAHSPAPPASPTSAPTPNLSRLLERIGAARIALLTPTEGVGAHPRFEWQPVPGAARYTLLLLDAEGRPYWAWEGAETAVYLGGGSQPPPEDSAGPILLRPMQWYVLAFDAEGKIIGYSEKRPIAP
jgi:hypothetical protein